MRQNESVFPAILFALGLVVVACSGGSGDSPVEDAGVGSFDAAAVIDGGVASDAQAQDASSGGDSAAATTTDGSADTGPIELDERGSTTRLGSVQLKLLAPCNVPTARLDAAMATDEKEGRVLLFGGRGSDPSYGGYLRDTWLFEAGQWREVHTSSAPPGRLGHALAYDESRARFVLYGGHVEGASGVAAAPVDDRVWEFDPERGEWSDRGPGVGPGPLTGATLVYDEAIEQLLLLGGGRAQVKDEALPTDLQKNVWTWTGERFAAAGALPQAVAGAITASFVGGSLLVYNVTQEGFAVPARRTADGWAAGETELFLLGSVPRKVAPLGEGALLYQASVGSQVLMLLGGDSPQPVRGDIGDGAAITGLSGEAFVLGSNGLQRVTSDGTLAPGNPDGRPGPRAGAGMVYLPERDAYLLHGGAGFNDTWLLEPDGTWRDVTTEEAPPPGLPHLSTAIAFDGARVVLLTPGNGAVQPTTWAWQDGVGWSVIATGTGPAAGLASPFTRSSGPRLVFDAKIGRLLALGESPDAPPPLLGGTVPAQLFAFEADAWELVPNTQGVGPTAGFAMAYNSELGTVAYDQGGTFAFDGAEWTRISAPGSRDPVATTLATGPGNRLYRIGGFWNGPQPNAFVWDSGGGLWVEEGASAPGLDREAAAAAYDSQRDRLVLFGGVSSASAELCDTWVIE